MNVAWLRFMTQFIRLSCEACPAKKVIILAVLSSALFSVAGCENDCDATWMVFKDDVLAAFQDRLSVMGDGVVAGTQGVVLRFEATGSFHAEFEARVGAQKNGDPKDVYANGDKSKTFVIVGGEGMLQISLDGGDKWFLPDIQEPPLAESSTLLSAVDFGCTPNGLQSDHGIVVGDDVILLTGDAGLSWTRSQFEMNLSLSDVKVLNGGVALATGENVILRTEDFGVTWNVAHMFGGDDERLSWIASKVCKIPYATSGRAVVVGGDRGGFLVSNDSGVTWEEISGPQSGSPLSSFDVIAEDKSGLLVGRGVAADELWGFHRDSVDFWTKTHTFDSPIRSVIWKYDAFLDEQGAFIVRSMSGSCHPR